MSFKSEMTNTDTVLLYIDRTLDFRNVSDFLALCESYISEGIKNFILDLNQTGFLDSTGLGALYGLYRKLRPYGGSIVFSSPSRAVQAFMHQANAYRIFPQFESIEAAKVRFYPDERASA